MVDANLKSYSEKSLNLAREQEEEVIDALEKGVNFLVEAGAGSGKTHTLMKVIDWIQNHKREEFENSTKKVVCITYTNAAVDVILERLPNQSFIEPCTIHSFAWRAIKQYQLDLCLFLDKLENITPLEKEGVKHVEYSLGYRQKEGETLHLSHNDVIHLFALMLGKEKFSKIFSQNYPLILIDEYQDSPRIVINQFIEQFIKINRGTKFGFFGDSWQTIYNSKFSVGEINNISHLQKFNKNVNFRSSPEIVAMLNRMRPDLPQEAARTDLKGSVTVITSEDFIGERQEGYHKGELPDDELKARLNKIQETLNSDTDTKNTHLLMLTHRYLARQNDYEEIFSHIEKKIKDESDEFVNFFVYIIEPAFEALRNQNIHLLRDILIKFNPIKDKKSKLLWRKFKDEITEARTQKAIDVIRVIEKYQLIPLPESVKAWLDIYKVKPNEIYCSNKKTDISIRDFLELPYKQFENLGKFYNKEALFGTEHGSKGLEFDNVLCVLDKSWKYFDFAKSLPNSVNSSCYSTLNENDKLTRNLFYVICSRPIKHLFIFISFQVELKFLRYLQDVFGAENIVKCSDFLKKKSS